MGCDYYGLFRRWGAVGVASRRIAWFLILLLPTVCLMATGPSPLMPQARDRTQMWWADGFPSHTPTAPWVRVIQTGHYAAALNTETLRMEHFGAVEGMEAEWRRLPGAQLELAITMDGRTYRCAGGGPWSRWAGPRLIESGRFFQRADVTDLVFAADDGSRLNVEARFETVAWSDRLSLILAARPGHRPIAKGESSFGRVNGGFGLDGTNHFEIPPGDFQDHETFTLALWAFLPSDYRVSEKTFPWLMCKNAHEQAEGNIGIVILNGLPQARLNIGGGRDNAFTTEPVVRGALRTGAWNHLAVSYDGDRLRLFANGALAGDKRIGRKRLPVPGAVAFGRRQDNSGDGYHFRGVVDEVRWYARALTVEELRLLQAKPEISPPNLEPESQWTFDAQGSASAIQPREEWSTAAMELRLVTDQGVLAQHEESPKDRKLLGEEWRQVVLAMDPVAFRVLDRTPLVTVQATEIPTGRSRTVEFDPEVGWHRINLDGIEPVPPPGRSGPSNDALERVKLVLSNYDKQEQVARLMFEKTARGFRQRIGTPITGFSAILRDEEGNPTGLPVQLSKNWHNEPEGGVYGSQWFHGISQVRLPPGTTVSLELTLAYGHWGGVAAASHAQLCLVGWGSNQLWEQSALGSWGESICYEPDQVQADCTITDVRPVMVRSMGTGAPWGWTSNVGGGDFFRCFDVAGNRIAHRGMRTTSHRQGPCFTEVTFAGGVGEAMAHSTSVSLGRTDDIVRGCYRLRLDVNKAVDFSRFVIFQFGSDTYNSISGRGIALGNENGLIKEWATQRGGPAYRTEPMECQGRIPWLSLHDGVPRGQEPSGAIANRGLVIRSWKARLGGKPAAPWAAEHGVTIGRVDSSTIDLLTPPGVNRLEPGDFIEATIELVVMPQFAGDYYGPNVALRDALTADGNTWRMIHREAIGNDRRVEVKSGTLLRTHPAITIEAEDDRAECVVSGGLGHVPLIFSGLTSPASHTLFRDGQPLDQQVHGNDFWQTDYDSVAGTWSRTYTVPVNDAQPHAFRLAVD